MRFLSPTGLWLLSTLPVITAFYILRIRREQRRVPSSWLWEKTLGEIRADTPFQRLKANLLFFLQLLAAVLLALAAARPVLPRAERIGANLILILDASAGMQAASANGRTRFENGRALLLDHLAAAAGGDSASVILAGKSPQVLAPLSTDLAAAEQALRQAKPTDGETDLEAAIRLGAALASRSASPHLVVASGNGPALHASAMSSRAPAATIYDLNEPTENAGIVTFEARRTGTALQSFVAVENFGAKPRTLRLETDLDGTPVDSQTLDLLPGERKGATTDLPLSAHGILRARIDGSDALAADDQAWALLPKEAPMKILLVTSGNIFLETAWSLESRLQLKLTTPEEFRPSMTDRFDLVAFDRWAPKEIPAGNFLFFGAFPQDRGLEIEASGTSGPEAVTVQDSKHPLMRHVDISDVAVAQALRVRLKPWVRSLARSDKTDLIVSAERDNHRMVATTFSLLDSDWPLRVSFPIFLSNATVWLARPIQSGTSGGLRPGDAIDLSLASPGKTTIIETPDGRKISIGTGARTYTDTPREGIYRLRSDEKETLYAFNLLSEKESRLYDPARPTFEAKTRMPTEKPALRWPFLGGPGLWRLLAAFCLGLLMFEWVIYLRRSWAS